MRRRWRAFVLELGLLSLVSCGGGSGGDSATPATPAALSISPGAAVVGAGTTQTFLAQGGTGPYTYSVSAGLGTIGAASGVYSVPISTGSAIITVTDALGKVAQSSVTINPPLSISPASITMPASSGQSYSFAAQNGVPGYQYTLLSGPGSISASGVYMAGTSSGTATVQVADLQGTTATATVASVFVRTNGPVYSAVTDGTNWYLGGSFSAVNAYEAPHVAVINTGDGSPNLACDLQQGFDDAVNAVASDATAVYVAGKFTHYRGVATPGGLVRIDPVTCKVLGTYFYPTDGARATDGLALNGSSLYFLAEGGPSYRGAPVAHALIKVNASSGALDPTFSANFPIYNIAPTAMVATVTHLYAGPFKVDATTGSYDPSFSVFFGNSSPQAFVAAGSSLYAVGAVVNGVSADVAKVDANTGALDPLFVPQSFDGLVQHLALVGNALYVTGSFTHFGSQPRLGVVKLDATTGAIDPNFAPSVDLSGTNMYPAPSYSVAVVDGALYVASKFAGAGNMATFQLAKLDLNTGTVDLSFTQPPGFNGVVSGFGSVGHQLFVGGQFTTYRGLAAWNLAKLNIADGTADRAFLGAKGTDGPVNALVLSGGALYLGGNFQRYGVSAAPYLAKVNSVSGSLDSTFTQATGPDRPVHSMTTDGSWLYIAGEHFFYRGVLNPTIAKISLVDGSLGAGFIDGFGGGFAYSIGVNGQYLYVFDISGSYQALPYLNLLRINSQTGALDTGFPLQQNTWSGSAMAFNRNVGYVALAHGFGVNGLPASWISKFDASTGTLDTQFQIPPTLVPPLVDAMLPLGSSLYVVGTSDYLANAADDFLVKVDATTGAPDSSFSQPSSMTNAPMRLLVTTGSDLWIGGDFTQYRGSRGYYFIPVDRVTAAAADPQ